jgi:uncharacterized protein (TIGR03083 family)
MHLAGWSAARRIHRRPIPTLRRRLDGAIELRRALATIDRVITDYAHNARVGAAAWNLPKRSRSLPQRELGCFGVDRPEAANLSTRPLRQYYEPVAVTIPDEVDTNLAAWRRHRQRLLDALRALPDDGWCATTRCTAWDVKDVVGHLVTVDAFWVVTLSAALARQTPTTYLRHFDPSTGTDDLVTSMRELENDERLDRLTTGTQEFVELVHAFAPEDWSSIGESPLGHLPARVLFGHAFWDSWLHERDIFEPHGLAPRVEPDELLAATGFSLVFAGLQGGLIGDPTPVGDGLTAPVDVTLRFEDLPDTALRVRISSGVHIERAEATTAAASGSAVALVECLTGRRPLSDLDGDLPTDLRTHLARASQVL